jgi:hypothetical protein
LKVIVTRPELEIEKIVGRSGDRSCEVPFIFFAATTAVKFVAFTVFVVLTVMLGVVPFYIVGRKRGSTGRIVI